jgi:hypothetical protein
MNAMSDYRAAIFCSIRVTKSPEVLPLCRKLMYWCIFLLIQFFCSPGDSIKSYFIFLQSKELEAIIVVSLLLE